MDALKITLIGYLGAMFIALIWLPLVFIIGGDITVNDVPWSDFSISIHFVLEAILSGAFALFLSVLSFLTGRALLNLLLQAHRFDSFRLHNDK